MGVVGVLRILWRRRVAVVAVAALAAIVGIAIAYRISLPGKIESRQYHVGVASARALVDTPSSQVVDLGLTTGGDIGTLSARAQLLASLITSSPMKDEIASRAGVDPNLLVTPPSSSAAAAAGGGGASPVATNVPDAGANVLRASVPSLDAGTIPIIAVETQAPDAHQAAILANEAIAVLQAHLQTVAGTERVPESRRVVVRALGAAASTTVRRGPSRMLALFAAFAAFAAGCGTILAVSVVARDWRRSSDDEPGAGDGRSWAGPREADDLGHEAVGVDDRLRAATRPSPDASAALGQSAAMRFAATDGSHGARVTAFDEWTAPERGRFGAAIRPPES